MKTRIEMGCRLAVAALLLTAAAESRADQLIMKNGQAMEAKSIRYKPSTFEYIVVTAEGTTVPIPAKNVDHAVVPRPPALDAAIASLSAGKYDAAIAPLETVISDNAGLEWDNMARDVLGQAYMGKKDFKKAVSLYKEILEAVPAERLAPGVRRHYWEALNGAESYVLLKKDLDEAIGKGPRDMAAVAQLLRGDMYLAQGQKNEALLDYLRTVILYEKETAIQPEALYKAAGLLENLRDPRAADMRKKLAAEYPNSPYAKKDSGS
jgi:tetratricopeptide (TPR) repeat protein